MIDLSESDIKILLRPFVPYPAVAPAGLYGKLAQYLELILKWNTRTNLTSIRNPEEIVRRHFGESLFAAQHLGECKTLLDFGSGAGFPGLPIQLMHPALRTTLAESQNKKASFLREVVRVLGLETEVWAGRVESMPNSTRFDVVTLRAVDNTNAAIETAPLRAEKKIMLLNTSRSQPVEISGFIVEAGIPIPGSKQQQLLSYVRK